MITVYLVIIVILIVVYEVNLIVDEAYIVVDCWPERIYFQKLHPWSSQDFVIGHYILQSDPRTKLGLYFNFSL